LHSSASKEGGNLINSTLKSSYSCHSTKRDVLKGTIMCEELKA